MEKSILIIGAGIAGLAAGCYAQMNGYRTKIFELHDQPGGLCTSWQRKGYTFDGCLQFLLGSAPGQPFSQAWEELGALKNRPMITHDEFIRIFGTPALGRKILRVFTDPDRLEQHLLELSPADAPLIKAFAEGIRQLGSFDLSSLQQKPKALMSLLDWAAMGWKMLPYIPSLARWGWLSMRELGERFQDPFLRQAIPLIFSWEEMPVVVAMSLLASMPTGNAAFPAGGSLEFARAIERRYRELGGEIFYNRQVEKILVENHQAVGVRLYDDEIHRADLVISTADGRATIFDMLGGEYVNRSIRRLYDGSLPVFSQFQVSLGVKRDLSGEPHWAAYLLERPVLIAGEERNYLSVRHYGFDPSLSPPGKSAVVVLLRTNYNWWGHLYGRRSYDTEQRQVTDLVIEQLEKIYPGLSQDIEVKDEATPLSFERFTGNWQGSSAGWLLTKHTLSKMITGMRKTLPGLRNFYMAGQWVEPGGSVSLVAMSGRNVIQSICHADGKPFVTSKV